jgi:putative peptidoglycan lipid II flippase
MLFASWFGTSDVAAAYRISQSAFLVPIQGLVGDTLGGGALPLYRGSLEKNPALARAFVYATLAQGIILSAIIWAVLFFFPANIVDWMAPGVSASAQSQATVMLRVMSFAVPALILGNSFGYIDAAHGRYAALSSRTTLMNVGVIGASALAYITGNSNWLAIGTAVSYVAFLIWTAIEFANHHSAIKVSAPFRPLLLKASIALWRNTGSLMALPLIAQGNVLVERIVASRLGTAVVPGLDYARFVSETTLVLSAVPLGIVTLASQSGSSAESARNHARLVAALLLALAFPLAFFLCTNAYDIVRVLYARGAFDETSVHITGSVLAGGTLGLGCTVTAYFLVKALNSQLRNLEAVLVVAVGAVMNSAFDLVAWRWFGPVTLGLGASLNGLAMLLVCLIRLNLFADLAPLLGWLLVGCAGMVGLHYAIPDLYWPVLRLAVFAIACVPWWALLYFVSSPLRLAVEPIRRKLAGYLLRWRRKPA